MGERIITIHRAEERPSGFTVISRLALEDPRLSYPSKGLLSYLLAKPNDWKVNIKNLANNGKASHRTIYKILDELILYGYVRRTKSRNTRGTYGKVIYEVYENPLDNPLNESDEGLDQSPHIKIPDVDNSDKDTPHLVDEIHTKYTEILSTKDNEHTTTGSVCVDGELIELPRKLLGMEKAIAVMVTEARKEHRIAIVRTLIQESEKGERGERAKIADPGGYLWRLCDLSKNGRFVMPGNHRVEEKISQNTKQEENIGLKQELYGKISGYKYRLGCSGANEEWLTKQISELEKEQLELQEKNKILDES